MWAFTFTDLLSSIPTNNPFDVLLKIDKQPESINFTSQKRSNKKKHHKENKESRKKVEEVAHFNNPIALSSPTSLAGKKVTSSHFANAKNKQQSILPISRRGLKQSKSPKPMRTYHLEDILKMKKIPLTETK